MRTGSTQLITQSLEISNVEVTLISAFEVSFAQHLMVIDGLADVVSSSRVHELWGQSGRHQTLYIGHAIERGFCTTEIM